MNATTPTVPDDARDRADIRTDNWFRWLVTGAGVFVLVSLAAAALSMLWGGREAFQKFGIAFLWSDEWDAVRQQFGALVPIYGTLVTATIAMIINVAASITAAARVSRVRSSGGAGR